ncbi:uncharacterized protein KY384_004275 [Bacidia gigantensis]|uniref:uncharacterized protein n=1 Tax=Bacidia gigantensis TaxID=2732470 RepID=UPI001D04DDE6|nr:uncharacterized protein KY384_004275 [Bacidia gigantensis]KAG8530918.1 hypothetical protein KY384_004275 [Bacidia gigantensis]
MKQIDSAFASWFIDNGGYLHPSMEIALGSNGNALRVKPGSEPLECGSKIVSCPKTLMVSFAAAHSSSLLESLNRNAPNRTGNEIISLRFFLVEQLLLGQDSFWSPYIQRLPQPGDSNGLNTTLYYDQEDFKWLQGTNLGAATLGRTQLWRQEYEDSMKILRVGSATYDWNPWTWELYLWATTVLTSRSFPVASVFKPDEDIPALVPGLDLLNHSPSAQVVWNLDGDRYTISVDEPIHSGCEVLNNYGPKSNEELLIGYGFCIAGNTSDSFGLGFNSVVSNRIQAIKESRGISILQKATPNEPKGADENDAKVSEQHSVWLKKCLPPNNIESPYQFSSYFLEHSSIAVENEREQRGHRLDWASSQTEWTADSLCRNKLHVLATTTMLLEKSMLEIRHHNGALSKPRNQRQVMAALYRNEQLKILDAVIANLRGNVRALLEASTVNSVWRLQQALHNGPKLLTKDLRSLIHLALGTRNEAKIKERGGEECVFALWLCGLWVLQQRSDFDDNHPSGTPWISWVKLLEIWYGSPSTPMDTSWKSPSSQPSRSPEVNELAAIGASYWEAIRQTVQKYPQSLYNSPSITVPVLMWCLNIVRSESVRLPDPFMNVEEEEDEYILVIESSA